MKKLIVFAVAVMICGCSSFKKQKDRAEAFYQQYPNELAKVCADNFPVKEKLIQGRDTVIHDTLKKFITVDCPPNQKDTLHVQVPVPQVITKTIRRVDTLLRENTARVEAVRTQAAIIASNNESLVTELARVKSQSSHRLLWIVGASILAVVSIALNLKLFFKW